MSQKQPAYQTPDPNLEAARVRVQAGRKALAGGLTAEAEQIAAALQKEIPELPGVHVLIGLIAARKGAASLGVHHLERGLRGDLVDPEAREVFAMLLMELGMYGKAEMVWRKMLSRNPNNAAVYGPFGICLLHASKPAEALAALDKAIWFDSKNPVIHLHRGRALEELGRPRDAVAAYEKSIQLDSRTFASHAALWDLLCKLGDSTRAVQYCKALYDVDPDGPEGLHAMAQVLLQERKAQEALEYTWRAIALAPGLVKLHVSEAACRAQVGDFAGAQEAYRKAIELEPGNAALYAGLASICKFTQEDRVLLEQMVAAHRELPARNSSARAITYAIAKAFDDLGDYESAMRYSDEANRLTHEQHKGLRIEFKAENVAALSRGWKEAFSPEHFEVRPEDVGGSDTETPVFIVGMVRSGTTLVEQIVSSHPEVGSAGELRFWVDVCPKPFEATHTFPAASSYPKLAEDYLKLLSETAPNRKRVTDKMPLNYRSLGLIASVFPKARFIHCRRNPIDTCLSIWMTNTWMPFGHIRQNIVHEYRAYFDLMAYWRSVLPPGRLLEVDYEDLVTDKQTWIPRMIEFLGLDWDEACLTPEGNTQTVYTPSLWQVRQPIYSSSIARWKHYEPWLREFEQLRDLAR